MEERERRGMDGRGREGGREGGRVGEREDAEGRNKMSSVQLYTHVPCKV